LTAPWALSTALQLSRRRFGFPTALRDFMQGYFPDFFLRFGGEFPHENNFGMIEE
jgi:hypothetical protein